MLYLPLALEVVKRRSLRSSKDAKPLLPLCLAILPGSEMNTLSQLGTPVKRDRVIDQTSTFLLSEKSLTS